MARNSTVSRSECERIHDGLDTRLNEMHNDIKTIKNNDIFHLSEKIDNQWKFIILVTILSVIGLGIKGLEIIGLIA